MYTDRLKGYTTWQTYPDGWKRAGKKHHRHQAIYARPADINQWRLSRVLKAQSERHVKCPTERVNGTLSKPTSCGEALRLPPAGALQGQSG